MMKGLLSTLSLICSNPKAVAERCRREEDLEVLTQAALVLLIFGTGAFGLVLGGTRDTLQALATAVKLPLVWIISLSLATPAFYALVALFGQPLRLRALLALTLVAKARASLVLFALLPVLWLFSDASRGSAGHYHQVTMLAALLYGGALLAALGVLVRALQRVPTSLPLMGLCALTLFMVAGQTAWSLRPFVGRPAEASTPLWRQPEGTFLEALRLGADSARGRYRSNSQLSSAAEHPEL